MKKHALESTWDEGGPEAQARWEAHWPYSDRIRCRFSWKNIRRAEADIPSINNLILSYGGDPLDEGLLSLFLKAFQEALPVKCEAYKEPPEPAVIPSESDLAEAAKLA
jgi:tagatose-1,6-bisphosphate aldolase non-catalytic subunit AgaZ/GatZ